MINQVLWKIFIVFSLIKECIRWFQQPQQVYLFQNVRTSMDEAMAAVETKLRRRQQIKQAKVNTDSYSSSPWSTHPGCVYDFKMFSEFIWNL